VGFALRTLATPASHRLYCMGEVCSRIEAQGPIPYICGGNATMETLRVGERFPVLEARAVEGSTLRIPDDLHDLTAVLIFYRGHW
jgi:hypothetical protein